MGKIILRGLLVGLLLLVAGMLFTWLSGLVCPATMAEYENIAMFRPWDDPLMSIFFLYPFAVGVILSWAWNKAKKLFTQKVWYMRALCFGSSYWLIATIPGMIITYSSFQVSLGLTFSWLISGLLNGVVAGMVLVKMDK